MAPPLNCVEIGSQVWFGTDFFVLLLLLLFGFLFDYYY